MGFLGGIFSSFVEMVFLLPPWFLSLSASEFQVKGFSSSNFSLPRIFHQGGPSHVLVLGGASQLQQLHLHQPGGGEVVVPLQQLHLHHGGDGVVVGLSRF